MATMIFSIVAMALGLTLNCGLRLWNRARNFDLSGGQRLLGISLLARDLRQSIDFDKVGFQGGALQMTFPVANGDTIEKVCYIFSPEDKTLIRRTCSLNSILEEKEEYSQKEVMSAESLVFSFYNFDLQGKGGCWVDEWEKKDGIFTAVKLEGKADGTDFNRIIIIPVAQYR